MLSFYMPKVIIICTAVHCIFFSGMDVVIFLNGLVGSVSRSKIQVSTLASAKPN